MPWERRSADTYYLDTAQDYGIVHWAIAQVKHRRSPLPCLTASGLSSTSLHPARPRCVLIIGTAVLHALIPLAVETSYNRPTGVTVNTYRTAGG